MQIVQFVSVLLVCHRLLILYEALSAILILAVKREKCSVLKSMNMLKIYCLIRSLKS